MSLWRWIGRGRTETKASAARGLGIEARQARPVWTPRDYASLAREGYQRNAVVHRAIRLIAEAAASVPLRASGAKAQQAQDLLARPNPEQTGRALLENVYGWLQSAGNAYVEAAFLDGALRELYALRPDRLQVVPGADGWPQAYDYRVGAAATRFGRVGARGALSVLHLKLFHPTDDHYGMSPLEAAAYAIDIHNAGGVWNKALLDNAARPSGALVVRSEAGERLSESQYQRLKEELASAHQGAAQAGRPLLLEGGLDWKPMGFGPQEMDFIEARREAAREIALAFGVPPMLLGILGDATYANYREANAAFWRLTILPLAQRAAAALGAWLSDHLDGNVEISCDLDALPALSIEREALWRRVGEADFLSADEKRAAVGVDPAGR